MIRKKTLAIVVALILIFISGSVFSSSEKGQEEVKKTIVVSLDVLDFGMVRQLGSDYSHGLISLKTGDGYGSSLESQFMTMATGRRVSIEGDSFSGIERIGEKLKVIDYSNIVNQLDRSYENFSSKMNFLGDSLRQNELKTSYIGNGEDILLIADKTGEVDLGETKVEYSESYLGKKIDYMMENSDLLVLSYDIENNRKRIELLSSLLSDRTENIIIIPRKIENDMVYKFNKTIAPILFKNSSEPGIITSDSTKREGLVSNTDIMVEILESYGIEQDFAIGNSIRVEPSSENRVDLVKKTMKSFLNLDIVKMIFRGIIIGLQIFLAVRLLRGKKITRPQIFMSPILILSTLLFGLTPLSQYLIPYITIVTAVSVFLSIYIGKKECSQKNIDILITATNVFIFIFLLWDMEVLYNSSIGYNSIVASLRFYGFNNDIMGVFLGTGILIYFWVSARVKDRYKPLLTLYSVLLVVSHTKNYGSNFGGLMTSTTMTGSLIYYDYFRGKKRNRRFAAIALALFLAVGAIVYIGAEGSHMGEFFIRVREYGYMEFLDMIYIKARQVITVVLLPPVGITMIVQSMLFFRYIRDYLEKGSNEYAKHMIIYAVAIFVTLFNDTGALAFIYIMTYALAKIMLELVEKNNMREEI